MIPNKTSKQKNKKTVKQSKQTNNGKPMCFLRMSMSDQQLLIRFDYSLKDMFPGKK